MISFSSISDPQHVEITQNKINNFWRKLLADERDIPFVKLSLQITFTLIPLAVLMYLPVQNWLWWFAAVFYTYLNNFVFKGPFGLMLHCTSHRAFFKKPYKYLNNYLPWIIGPFFGQTPETYFSHHLGMHHSENNLEDDISSTMHYRRDSFGDFMLYFLSFFFLGFFTLVKYFSKTKRKKLRNKVIRGEIFFFLFCIVLTYINWPATLVVFILPWFISRFIMMLGNWTQHAFIDFDEPGNCYKNSITCINTKYNHKCWNDGYHIDHHLKPSMHWTQYPAHFKANLSEFAKNKALVFDGIHYLHIWWYLMNKNYDKLAARLVNIEHTFSSDNEAIALMKSRTEKMPVRGISTASIRVQALK